MPPILIYQIHTYVTNICLSNPHIFHQYFLSNPHLVTNICLSNPHLCHQYLFIKSTHISPIFFIKSTPKSTPCHQYLFIKSTPLSPMFVYQIHTYATNICLSKIHKFVTNICYQIHTYVINIGVSYPHLCHHYLYILKIHTFVINIYLSVTNSCLSSIFTPL